MTSCVRGRITLTTEKVKPSLTVIFEQPKLCVISHQSPNWNSSTPNRRKLLFALWSKCTLKRTTRTKPVYYTVLERLQWRRCATRSKSWRIDARIKKLDNSTMAVYMGGKKINQFYIFASVLWHRKACQTIRENSSHWPNIVPLDIFPPFPVSSILNSCIVSPTALVILDGH